MIRYGHAGLEGAGVHDFRNAEDIMSAFSDIFGGGLFGDLFNQRRRGPRPGQDLLMKLEIELIEAARGTTKPIELNRQELCTECRGSGAKKGTVATTCNYCGGQGQVVQSRGFFQVATTCPACGGEGSRITDPCPNCRGSGRVAQTAHLKIDVPPGVETGMWLQLRNQGEPGDVGAPRGNLRIQIQVKRHPFFERPSPRTTSQIFARCRSSFPQAGPRGRDRSADAGRARPPVGPARVAERRRPEAHGPRNARHQRPGPRLRAGRGRHRDAEAPLSVRREEVLPRAGRESSTESGSIATPARASSEKLRDAYFTEEEPEGDHAQEGSPPSARRLPAKAVHPPARKSG